MNGFLAFWRTWVGTVLLVALAYYISGRLGLLLAVPPGYATAVWPPSGIALACLLVFGYRAWPGVLLGSFLVNIGTSFDSSTTEATLRSVALAVSIAGGASLQAIASAWLVRRFVGFPAMLNRDSDIVKLLLLGGPIGCVVNATIGVGALMLLGVFPSATGLFSWWTWWVGNTIGVLVFTPLALIWTGEPRAIWKERRLTVGLPLVVTFGAAVLCFFLVSSRERGIAKADFERVAQRTESRLSKNLDNYVEVLHSIQDLFRASKEVDRKEFKAFVESILKRYPAISALSFTKVIQHSERVAFEQAMRAEAPGFRITEISEEGKLSIAKPMEEYVVISYVEPLAENKRVLGLNVRQAPGREEPLQLAAKSGSQVGTRPIHLAQSIRDEYGMVVFAPIYENKQDAVKPVLLGYVSAVFKLENMLSTAIELDKNDDLMAVVSDIDSSGKRQIIFGNSAESAPILGELGWSSTLQVARRNWELQLTPSAGFIATHQSMMTYFVLAGGLLFTGILGAFLLVVSGRVTAIEDIVVQRTAELTETKVALEQYASVLTMQKNALLDNRSKLKEEAMTDLLTSLANRRAFNEFVEMHMVRASNSICTFLILTLDIDHFKSFNDNFGHAVGDEVLIKVANTMVSQSRHTDLCARIGGEEMAIVLPQSSLADGLFFAEKLRAAIEGIENDYRPITASFGVVAYSKEFENLDAMMAAADQALYEAKAAGRNQVRAWHPKTVEAA